MNLQEELKRIENLFKYKQQQINALHEQEVKLKEELVELNGQYKYVEGLIRQGYFLESSEPTCKSNEVQL